MKSNLENTWYNVHNKNKISTPGLLISPKKIKDNIEEETSALGSLGLKPKPAL